MRVTTTPAIMRILLCAVAILFFLPHHLHCVTHKFIENFSTKQYCDTLNTTAWWDTIAGELRLFPFVPTLVGTYDTPSSALSVTVLGDYAFVADHTSGLQVINIEDPANPAFIGTYATPDEALDVAIAGDHAFVADGLSGLQVLDIENPASPSLLDSYDTYYARGVAIAGDYAFVADDASGLHVIDITDPTNITLLDTYDTPDAALGVAVSGDYAFVADHGSGLLVIDISDPTDLDSIGSYDTPSAALGVAVSGDYAFVADYLSGLQIIDISDPTNPTFLGTCDTPDKAYNVEVSGDYAFVADEASGLHVIDISDPTDPAILWTLDTSGWAMDVAVAGEHAFVADHDAGLHVIDIADPANPANIGYKYTPCVAYNVTTSGDYAFVADGLNWLSVINISDPTNPTLLGTCDIQGYAQDVTVSGDYAFVTDHDSGLHVIDISDPTNPTPLGTYDTPGYPLGITVSGDHAFVADYDSGLHVIDISDPANPTLLGTYNTPGSARGITVSGDHAFVADGTSGLQVIDISNPSAPTFLGTRDTPGQAYGVTVSGDHVFVADHTSGLQVIDISDPTDPTILGTCDTPGFAEGVTVSGDYAFVADYTGLQVIDISDPANPTLLGSHETLGYARDVTVSGNYAFLADPGSGLRVIQVFQSELDSDNNVGRSLFVNASTDTILAVRLTTTQTASVEWELSADGGTNWQGVAPDGKMHQLVVPGIDLVWRSTHAWAAPGANPAVAHLEIEWLYEFAVVDSIWDVPNDQGRQVRIEWARSGYDYSGSPTPIIEYAIYRKIDYSLTALTMPLQPALNTSDGVSSEYIRPSVLAYPPGEWDYVTTVPARCEETYAAVVPTLADSTIDEGMYFTTFFVSAMTDTPGVYFDSYPDSGYSVDNLAPGVPTGLMVAYNTGSGNELTWDECSDFDFQYFCIYRSDEEGFEPSPENLEHMTASPSWTDPADDGWQYTYKITAVDFSGNESDAASATTVTGDETPSTPKAFALHQNVPNPFNPSTRIKYDLPRAAHVRLHIYDVSGRLVRALVDAEMEPGNREILWDGRDGAGRETASGIYFYRLTAGSFTETKKMVLLR